MKPVVSEGRIYYVTEGKTIPLTYCNSTTEFHQSKIAPQGYDQLLEFTIPFSIKTARLCRGGIKQFLKSQKRQEI